MRALIIIRRRTLALCCGLLAATFVTASFPGVTSGASNTAVPADTDEINQLLHKIVLEHVPHEYENTKKWGGTKEVWDGLKIWRDGLRIKTKRRKKTVKHGTWKRYRAWLVAPQEELHVKISHLRELDGGRIAFQLTMVARLGAVGRLSQWQRDVQLISVSANAKARVRLNLSCELGSELDFTHLPPDVMVVARVTQAQLDLLEFRLERLSELSGPLAKELGESLHDVLQDEINQRRHKLTERINRQLEKHQDDLRFSVHDLSERGWTELLEFLSVSEPDGR